MKEYARVAAEAERVRVAEAEAERVRVAEAEAERVRVAEAEAERVRVAEAVGEILAGDPAAVRLMRGEADGSGALNHEQMRYLASLTQEERNTYYGLVHQRGLELCRRNFPAFVRHVGRDEETGAPLVNDKIHLAIAEILDVHPFVVIFAHVASGKTTLVTVLRTLWEIGRDPSIRIIFHSSTVEAAGDKLEVVCRYLGDGTPENPGSAEYREVFPEVVRDFSARWVPSREITVKSGPVPQHPTVRCVGIDGSILSARCDLYVGDDVLESKHVVTAHERARVQAWFDKSILGRFGQRAPRGWMLGVPHHVGDLYHEMIKRGWKGFRFPVQEEDGALNSPRSWPQERIDRSRRTMAIFEASRQLDCRARSDEDAAFKEADIRRAVEAGDGLEMVGAMPDLPADCVIVVGVDLAVSRSKRSDSTSLAAVLGHPDGRRRLLSLETGRWRGRQILERIADHQRRYQCVVFVEDNAAQDFLVQFAREGALGADVRGFTTGMNKNQAFGVESLAAEMAAGRWIFPSQNLRCAPEVERLLDEILYYDPKAHTGDRLMALWIAKEGIRSLQRAPLPATLNLTLSSVRTGPSVGPRARPPASGGPPLARTGFHEVAFRERPRPASRTRPVPER